MHRVKRVAGPGLVLGALFVFAVWLWVGGGLTEISVWAAERQRDVQNSMAGALRAVRGGDPAALMGLMGLCFAYGFFHAAGPGHGKLVMGGYAMGEAVPRLRLIVLTLAGSMGQAVTAIVLVSVGAALFGWGRQQMTGLADGALAAFSAIAIVLVGLWLALRGVRRLKSERHSHDHHHHHHHHDDAVCPSCGHAHAPDPQEIAKVKTWQEAIGLVLAVAIRPCTGALFVLILTFGMGIPLVGILGALVMALGTAVLTLMVALGASILRGGIAERLQGRDSLRTMAVIEIAAGLIVAVAAGQVALRLL